MTKNLDVVRGTHMWTWEIPQIANGNPTAIAAAAKQLGLDGVLVKCANGSLANDPVSQEFMADFQRVIGPLKAAGLKVGAWIYQYLTDVDGEVDACSQAIAAGADWLVLDGEVELKGKDAQVQEFGQKLRAKHPDVVIGLSSFAIADYHPEVPFEAYHSFVDVMMPQVYWADMGWSVDTAFNLSINSYQKYGKPIAPTGQAYAGATNADMQRFVTLCKQAGFTHVSWWDWQHSTADQLRAVASTAGVMKPPAPPQPVPHVANDVEATRWSAGAIKWCMDNHIMVGDGNGNFNPTGGVTREMLAQALYAAFHQPK